MKKHVLIGATFFCLLAMPLAAHAQTCSPANLKGTYAAVLSGRNVNSTNVLSAALQSVGTATFDGAGAVSMALTTNTNLAQGAAQTLSGTYTLPANCVGSLVFTTGSTASFTLISFAGGGGFTLTGDDGTYALLGSGSPKPAACITSTLSGNYAFAGNGYSLKASTITGVNNLSGLLQFDGQGTLTGNWTVSTGAAAIPANATGHYSVTSACQASGTMTDSTGANFAFAATITSADGSNFNMDFSNSSAQYTVGGHSTFTSAGQAVVSAASGLAGTTPPGSIFALYGSALTTSSLVNGSNQATTLPLPTTLVGTTVTVNGEAVPLFYASPTQINAQMPLDIKPGLASVVVTTGIQSSNAAAIVVPAGPTPGIFIIGGTTSRAVLQNPDFSVNSSTSPAHIGDTVVGYFTGGGAVNPAGPLVTGAGSPGGLSPVTGTPVSVTVAGVPATVNYIGLTPTLVGVYQVNFVIPQVAPGDNNLVVSIAGGTSPAAVITVAN